ncbi:hypothetical protein MTO96_018290 [Rhipicephalus appendiculatus]
MDAKSEKRRRNQHVVLGACRKAEGVVRQEEWASLLDVRGAHKQQVIQGPDLATGGTVRHGCKSESVPAGSCTMASYAETQEEVALLPLRNPMGPRPTRPPSIETTLSDLEKEDTDVSS